MNRDQNTSRKREGRSIPLKESIEKRGWKEYTRGPRPAPPQGQGRTPISRPSIAPPPPQESNRSENKKRT